MKLSLFGVVILCLLNFQPALGVKCRLCWPPMDEDECKAQEKKIECRPWKNLGFDVCIEVEYPGNGTLARTCYPSYKCEGAKEWCRRYGPCTVKCCKGNLCNGGKPIKFAGHLLLPVILTSIAAILHL